MNSNVSTPTNPTAIASLVFGILSWIAIPFIGALVAIVCGHLARGEIRRAPPGTLQGDGLAVGGLILGYLHIVIVVCFVVFAFMFLGGIAWFAAHLH
ncbi:DUF4190 domain-containing protein [Rudaea sp.]|uniref:DUF4190 domain-containing protein n=1 Tax=Rudaea sp. TaxID=2136325 RepID=UPI00321F6464